MPERQVTPRFKGDAKPKKEKASKSRALAVIQDRDAAEIGELYATSGDAYADAVFKRLTCGKRLLEKKAALREAAGGVRGTWMKWLADNERLLGFGDSAANTMMKAYKDVGEERYSQLAGNMSRIEAERIGRKMWWHPTDAQLIQQSKTVEHYTPKRYIDAAREVLGEIDLDPSSCELANRTVKAAMFFSENGEERAWEGRVWLNPPYGGSSGKFIAKLAEEIAADNVIAAIALVNAHSTDAEWFKPLWDGVLCFTNHRINFYGQEDEEGGRTGNTHGSVFVYFGPEPEKFREHFAQFGTIVRRWGA